MPVPGLHPPVRKRTVNVAVSLPLDEFGKRLGKVLDGTSGSGNFDHGLPLPATFEGVEQGHSAAEFAHTYLWSEIFSKFDDGKSSDAKRDRAMEKFEAGELLCARTNVRLSRMVGMPSYMANTDLEQILCSARGKIRGILGRLNLDEVAAGFEFTSGASTRLPRVRSSVAHKFSGTPDTTFGNLALAEAAVRSLPLWKQGLFCEEGAFRPNIVEGNKIITVAKNYKEDRTIAIEPDLNMYIQKGFGSVIRRRLRRHGIDLNNQETNGDLARFASSTGQLATIDLSMASDTVSLELVRFLLPSDWCEALEQCRSPFGILPSGEKILYRKFSSMGNGATFELESLIFYGLILGCLHHCGMRSRLVGVYGDDLIVPSAMAPLLIRVLEFAGFKPNVKKTHISGPFRESCGKHYFNGQEVTPFYVKKKVVRLLDLFKIHNQLYRWAQRTYWSVGDRGEEVRQLLRWIRSFAPSNWRRPRIPDGYGDCAFIGSFDEARPLFLRLKNRQGWEGYSVNVLSEVAVTADFYEAGWGTIRKNEFRPCRHCPTSVGRLLQSLARLEVQGDRGVLTGLPVGQRPRIIPITVDGYALDNLSSLSRNP